MKLRLAKKTNGRRRRGRATSLWNILTGRWGKQHRLPAHVTGEGDWEVEVPQIRMSRAFAVMLVLHIVAVGGLFAFRIWGKDDDEKGPTAENTSAPAALVEPATPADAASVFTEPATATGPVAITPAEPLKTYVWHTGDTLPLVAARFGISGSALREANPDKQLLPGTELVIPRAGRVIGGADTSDAEAGPAEIFDPAKSETAATSRPPRAEVVPELAPFPEIPDVLPSHAEEAGGTVAQKVTARPPVKPVPAKAGDVAAAKKKAAVTIPPVPPARTAGQRAHVVTSGDTVFNIAKRYGFTAEEIAKANGLGDGYRIRKGQQLRIPVRR